MQLDRKNLVSGGIGALLGACSILGIEAVSDDVASTFHGPSARKAKGEMYERVETNMNGDVYITPKGKKYHRSGCFILNGSDEMKQVARSEAASVGYQPCRKCKP